MATTTNYGWTTPDDTALVKDGAAAIRTLGSSVDTTTKALNPSTTLGDIEYRSSTANTNTRLPIGTTGQVLAVSGGVPAWTTAAGAKALQIVAATTTTRVNTTSTSYVSTGLSVSITPSATSSKILLIACGPLYQTGRNVVSQFRFTRGGSEIASYKAAQTSTTLNADEFMFPLSYSYVDSPSTTSSTTYVLEFNRAQADSGASAISWCYPDTVSTASIIAIEIGA